MAYKKKQATPPPVSDRIEYVVTDKIEATVNNRTIKAARGDRVMLNATEGQVLARFVIAL